MESTNSISQRKKLQNNNLQDPQQLRPLLTTYAYNISGSWEDAKDVVQEVYLQFMRQEQGLILNHKAYLIRMVINLALNQKQKHKKLVKQYPGQWLPEPVASEKTDGALQQKEILSYSLLVLLEKLNARQRAVFILKEAFDYEHSEIAEVLGISIEHSRKILSRAKKQLREGEKLHDATAASDFLERYLQVIQTGNTRQLELLLHEDVVMISDGGGKVPAAINPLVGRKTVVSFLAGIYKKFYGEITFIAGEVNHQPALFYYQGQELVNCHIFAFEAGLVQRMYVVRNPDKLKSLQKKEEN